MQKHINDIYIISEVVLSCNPNAGRKGKEYYEDKQVMCRRHPVAAEAVETHGPSQTIFTMASNWFSSTVPLTDL